MELPVVHSVTKLVQATRLISRGAKFADFPGEQVISALLSHQEIGSYLSLLSNLNEQAIRKLSTLGYFFDDLKHYMRVAVEHRLFDLVLDFLTKARDFPAADIIAVYALDLVLKAKYSGIEFYKTVADIAGCFQEAHYVPFVLQDIVPRADLLTLSPMFLKCSLNVNEVVTRKRPAVFSAISANDVSLLKMYINCGAQLHAKDEHGRTTLMFAALGASLAVMKCLCRFGAPIAGFDPLGRTAAYYCVKANNFSGLQVLIDAGICVTTEEIISGCDPLMCALKENNSKMFLLLISSPHYRKCLMRSLNNYKGVADPPTSIIRYWQGQLFLQAIRNGDISAMQHLMQTGVDAACERTDQLSLNMDWSYLMVAAKNDQAQATRLLLYAGADPYYRSSDGLTAFDLAKDPGVIYMLKGARRYISTAAPRPDEMDIEALIPTW